MAQLKHTRRLNYAIIPIIFRNIIFLIGLLYVLGESIVTPNKSYIIQDPEIYESRHLKWLQCAAKQAHKSTFKKYKMAAICVRGGRVIGIGFNKDKDGSVKNKNYVDRGHHAELDLILSMPADVLKGSTIYVAGITRGGSLCWSSKPCPACQATLRSYGIKAAIYHDQYGKAYEWRTK